MSWQEGEWSRFYTRVCCRVGSWWGWQDYRCGGWGLRNVIEGGLMRMSWVDGSEERMWKPSLRIRLSRWRPK